MSELGNLPDRVAARCRPTQFQLSTGKRFLLTVSNPNYPLRMDFWGNREWPQSAPQTLANPFDIERFLRNEIERKQISLIGELDLQEPTSYAEIGWSLFDLASYLASKDIIKKSLTPEKMEQWQYPATLAIWTVGKAQIADDGIGLWELEGYSASQLANIALMFSKSIEILQLATFANEFLGKQKHVQLARIHAMIPDFAIHRYAEIVNRSVKYNQAKMQILHQIINDTSISKGVRKLFSARQDIGLDLIERSFNLLAYGYEADLPFRIKSKLKIEGVQTQKNRKSNDFPSLHFVEYLGGFEIRGGQAWICIDENGKLIDNKIVKQSNIYATSASNEKIPLVDLSKGYLIFDSKGNLQYGNSMPNNVGYLVWHKNTKILSEIDYLDNGYMPLWPDWNFTYFQDIRELVLELPDQKVKTLNAPMTLEVKDFIVPYLMDQEGHAVYSRYPEIESGQYFMLTNHLTGEQNEIQESQGKVLDESGGKLDITISTGLGKSRTWKGLVIPDVNLVGIKEAPRLGSKVNLRLTLPPTWNFTFPVEFSNKTEAVLNFVAQYQEPFTFRVRDNNNSEHFLGLEIPILSWSIEFSNQESITIASTYRLKTGEKKNVRALILHGVNEYLPILNVFGIPVEGRRRGQDVRYDLRILSDMSNTRSAAITMKWNYEDVHLIQFTDPQSNKMQVVDQKNLVKMAITKEIISQEQWDKYQEKIQRENQNLRNLLRRQRRG